MSLRYRSYGSVYRCSNDNSFFASPYTSVSDNGYVTFYNSIHRVHRLGGPAVITPEGKLVYKVNDKYHRGDGPAVITPDGKLVYKVNDQYHRIGGPALVNGNWVQYYLNDVHVPAEEYFVKYGVL